MHDAYTDFVLSRQVMNCTPATMEFYKYDTGRFMTWAEQQGVTSLEQPANYLPRNDAYPFFNALGDLLKTGPSGTNVNDLVFLFAL